MNSPLRNLYIFVLTAFFLNGGVLTRLPVYAQSPAAPAAEETDLFLVAQKAFDDGFYDVAMRYIDEFVKKYPQSQKQVEARLLLGQCYFFKSQYLKAFDIFQSL